jgi:hypothetical protein
MKIRLFFLIETHMRQLTTLIIITFTLNCFGQYQFDKTKISKQTVKVITKIEKVNELMGSAIYESGVRPRQYDNFTELQKKATQSELIALTNHPNGVVRCYAFWALSFNHSVDLLPIIIKHINDTTSIDKQFGCLGNTEQVGDFFINIVTPQYVDLNSKKLTKTEYEYLDSILVYTPNSLIAKENAISRIKPTEALYVRTRELVIKERNQSALVELAKYKREQDIPLILNNKVGNKPDDGFFFTYKAIMEFPHFIFFPFLKKNLQETLDDDHFDFTEWRELYKAIAIYKNDEANKLLQIPFTEVKHKDIQKYHIEFVFEATQLFYTPIYDSLLWKMWENDKLTSPKVFSLLYQRNPEKAFSLAKKTIQNAADLHSLSTGAFYGKDGEKPVLLLDLMLDTVLIKDKIFAIELINKNIKEIDVHQFPIFADKAEKIKDISFVASLFDRLEKESNPHIYLKATKVLISFNDKDINRRIVDVSKRNLNLRKDWGGKEFSKLLKENGIE